MPPFAAAISWKASRWRNAPAFASEGATGVGGSASAASPRTTGESATPSAIAPTRNMSNGCMMLQSLGAEGRALRNGSNPILHAWYTTSPRATMWSFVTIRQPGQTRRSVPTRCDGRHATLTFAQKDLHVLEIEGNCVRLEEIVADHARELEAEAGLPGKRSVIEPGDVGLPAPPRTTGDARHTARSSAFRRRLRRWRPCLPRA